LSGRLRGMGTTLVCACLDGNRIIIGNVGDSRAYFLRGGQCFQVTQDHSFVAEQLRDGLITPEMAAASDMQSVITRAVGVADAVEPDLFAAEVQEADMVLLTSDGLTRYVSDEEIGAMLGSGQTTESLCAAFVAIARERGGADNITCLILRIIRPPAA
jgi:PPM family protein phosphatase